MIHKDDQACEELFDSVGQAIFGVGLQLEQVLEVTEDPLARASLDSSIRGLHDIIGSIRNRGLSPCECSQIC